MSHDAVRWIAVSIVLLGLSTVLVILGGNFIPPLAEVVERGSPAPWRIAWGMIVVAVASALVLVGYLVSQSVGRSNSR